MLHEELLIEPLDVFCSLSHLREALVVHRLLHVLGKAELVLAAGEKPALLGIVAGEILLLRLAGGGDEQPCFLSSSTISIMVVLAGPGDQKAGPVHQLHFILRG